ncbi:hypothetical protein CTEN210_01542 [Chaetoceros tenuissimus]|uniref:HSF-type DNA-binding domain-containing protein n=1 Tax=Chaetoceros tenuissimus TaxID=426638 RepID=A0AAD3CFU2_9STRA|nr:hypothetical protein CTEN210_01542 [Chaetoceros tenuissimus]
MSTSISMTQDEEISAAAVLLASKLHVARNSNDDSSLQSNDSNSNLTSSVTKSHVVSLSSMDKLSACEKEDLKVNQCNEVFSVIPTGPAEPSRNPFHSFTRNNFSWEVAPNSLERKLGTNPTSVVDIASRENVEANPTRTKRFSFPEIIHDLLEDPAHADILRWLPGGKAFIILDTKRFTEELLSTHFKQAQYTSFTRRLGRWKFTRVPRGPFLGAYYHKLFRKGHKYLCKFMSCSGDSDIASLLKMQGYRNMQTSPKNHVSDSLIQMKMELEQLRSLRYKILQRQMQILKRLKQDASARSNMITDQSSSHNTVRNELILNSATTPRRAISKQGTPTLPHALNCQKQDAQKPKSYPV